MPPAAPVTFCCTVNWHGPDDGVAPMFAAYRGAVAGVLGAVAEQVRLGGHA